MVPPQDRNRSRFRLGDFLRECEPLSSEHLGTPRRCEHNRDGAGGDLDGRWRKRAGGYHERHLGDPRSTRRSSCAAALLRS